MTPTDPAMAATDLYVPTAEAAELTGVPVRTIRRWAKSGHVPAMTGPHKILVDLVAVQRLAATSGHTDPVTRPVAANGPKVVPDGPYDPVMAQDGPATGITDLVRLVEKQQRELVELAGRCGWLQSENQRLSETIRQLQTPAHDTGEALHNCANGPERPPGTVQRPRWWQWWRRLSPGVSA